MDLFALRKLITESRDEEWHTVKNGPYFHDGFGEVQSAEGHYLEHQTHYYRFVLMSDVDVSIEFGMSLDSDRNAVSLKGFGWDFTFPDESLRREFIDIFYRGALVDRLLVLDVDGGRSTLPIARKIDGEWAVLGWEHDLVALVDSLGGNSEFNGYFGQTDWKVVR
jgi:hypothetical protein